MDERIREFYLFHNFANTCSFVLTSNIEFEIKFIGGKWDLLDCGKILDIIQLDKNRHCYRKE